ncbi:uncharacterized protein AAEQ78_025490 isoform 1-T2 [Lycaon pictus]
MAEDNRFPRPSLPGTQLERSLGQSRSLLVTADRTVGALQPSHVSSRRPHPVLSPLPLLPHPWLERERDVVSQRKRFCLQARQGLSPPHPILVSTRWHLSVTSKTVKRARAEPAPRPVPYAAGTLSTRKSPRSLGPHPWLSGVETNKEPAPGRATARGRTSSQQAASGQPPASGLLTRCPDHVPLRPRSCALAPTPDLLLQMPSCLLLSHLHPNTPSPPTPQVWAPLSCPTSSLTCACWRDPRLWAPCPGGAEQFTALVPPAPWPSPGRPRSQAPIHTAAAGRHLLALGTHSDPWEWLTPQLAQGPSVARDCVTKLCSLQGSQGPESQRLSSSFQ